jgi:hypothetical protein
LGESQEVGSYSNSLAEAINVTVSNIGQKTDPGLPVPGTKATYMRIVEKEDIHFQ